MASIAPSSNSSLPAVLRPIPIHCFLLLTVLIFGIIIVPTFSYLKILSIIFAFIPLAMIVGIPYFETLSAASILDVIPPKDIFFLESLRTRLSNLSSDIVAINLAEVLSLGF